MKRIFVMFVTLALLVGVSPQFVGAEMLSGSDVLMTQAALEGGVAVQSIQNPELITGGQVDASSDDDNGPGHDANFAAENQAVASDGFTDDGDGLDVDDSLNNNDLSADNNDNRNWSDSLNDNRDQSNNSTNDSLNDNSDNRSWSDSLNDNSTNQDDVGNNKQNDVGNDKSSNDNDGIDDSLNNSLNNNDLSQDNDQDNDGIDDSLNNSLNDNDLSQDNSQDNQDNDINDQDNTDNDGIDDSFNRSSSPDVAGSSVGGGASVSGNLTAYTASFNGINDSVIVSVGNFEFSVSGGRIGNNSSVK